SRRAAGHRAQDRDVLPQAPPLLHLSASFRRPADLLPLILLLSIAPTAAAAPPWNVGYRTIELQDPLTGESFPVALWYPTHAAPAPLFVTGSLSLCRLPAILS